MTSRLLPIRIISPSSERSARDLRRTLPESDLLVLMDLVPPGPDQTAELAYNRIAAAEEEAFDETAWRDRLRLLRQEAAAGNGERVRRFDKAVRSIGVGITHCRTADEAVDTIQRLAGGIPYAAVNRSGTVNHELVPGLSRAEFTIIDTYYQQFSVRSGMTRSFQLPRLSKARIASTLRNERFFEAFAAEPANVVGILGVSSASAEDGSVCFFQHFDNISEILSRAAKTILVVPIDKIVARTDDALSQAQAMGIFGLDAVPLELVPKDGTGPPLDSISPFPGELPAERVHVLVLDNGRSRLAAGPHAGLLACVSCRRCVIECPTFRYYGGPANRNPREYAASFILRQGRPLDLCTLCRRCLAVCPIGIDVPAAIRGARSEERAARGKDRAERFLSNVETIGRLGGLAPRLANVLARHPVPRAAAEVLFGIDRRRRFSPFADRTFDSWMRGRRVPGRRKTAFFAGCDIRFFRPEVGEAIVEILHRNDCEVIYPPQGCTGQPDLHEGTEADARRKMETNLASLDPFVRSGYAVITSCPACGVALKKDYPALAGTEAARRVAGAVRNIAEFLLDLDASGELNRCLAAPIGKETVQTGYHVPCHMKNQDQAHAWPSLLSLIPGVDVAPADKGCCGLSGFFGCKTKHFDRSMEIGQPLFEHARSSGLDLFATDCASCRNQIAQGSGRDVLHPIFLLRDAYRAGAEDRPAGRARSPR